MAPSLILVLAGTAVAAFSGVPAIVARHGKRCGAHVAAALAVCGALLGLAGALIGAFGGAVAATAAWSLPGGSFAIGLDGLSALFLLPVFGLSGLAAIYGLGYRSPGSAEDRRLRTFLGLLTAGMAVLLVARNGLLFLFGWELMALAAFFLIATDHHVAAARRAAWVYLVATHVGTLCLGAAFALLATPDGSLDWQPVTSSGLSEGRAVAVFVLALIGFGLKAGLMPLHFWLPAAHANAPSHVSAVLSGVVIEMGAYGLIRVLWLLPTLPIGCAVAVVALGACSALLGVAATLGQGDLKRLLAYSSIENLGIIGLGIGLALLGRATGSAELVVLGLGGSLFHALNHSIVKPLLFLGAGAVIHATGTRELDALGGLLRRMPRTGTTFLIGAVAISGLPLSNAFVGEFVLYLGLFTAANRAEPWVALLAMTAIAALALVGGLAVVSFVRAVASVFLGRARSPAAAEAQEATATMTAPGLALAAFGVVIGLFPWLVVPLLQSAVDSVVRSSPRLDGLVPFGTLSAFAVGCALAIAAGLAWLRTRRSRGAVPVGTWDCGFVDASAPRLQYSAASFAQLSTRMLQWTVRFKVQMPAPFELFAGPRAFARHAVEPLLDSVLWPLMRWFADHFAGLRVLQRGLLQVYLLYILIALVLLLAWSAIATPP